MQAGAELDERPKVTSCLNTAHRNLQSKVALKNKTTDRVSGKGWWIFDVSPIGVNRQ